MTRLVSALLLVALIFATVVWLPAWVTLVVAAAVSALAAGELAGMSARLGARVSAPFVAVTAVLITLAFAFDSAAAGSSVPALHVVLLALAVTGAAMALAAGLDAGTLTRAAVLWMAPIYVGLPLGTLAALRATDGREAVLFLIGIIAASDSTQFYAGTLFGRRKLAPVVSPGKTVEGLVGGLVVAAIVGAIVGPRLLPSLPVSVVGHAGLGVALALSGVVGDLFESLLKRSAGVKDSSSLIPGHGGVLDRIDSYLLAAPVFYLFLRFVA